MFDESRVEALAISLHTWVWSDKLHLATDLNLGDMTAAQVKRFSLRRHLKDFATYQPIKAWIPFLPIGYSGMPFTIGSNNNKDHGGRHDENSNAGDLGNITGKEDGKATFAFKTKKFTLFGDVTKSVIGRSIVIHEHHDDNGKGGFHDSLVTGHAGGRLDCAVIGHCK